MEAVLLDRYRTTVQSIVIMCIFEGVNVVWSPSREGQAFHCVECSAQLGLSRAIKLGVNTVGISCHEVYTDAYTV